jgi:uncharacterized glyoxalase superfamily protein PhnB
MKLASPWSSPACGISGTKSRAAAPGCGCDGTSILLAQASNEEQAKAIGNQSGSRVFLFLETDDFDRDFVTMTAKGIRFVREPATQAYGKVAVFEDLYGNLWDLVQST